MSLFPPAILAVLGGCFGPPSDPSSSKDVDGAVDPGAPPFAPGGEDTGPAPDGDSGGASDDSGSGPAPDTGGTPGTTGSPLAGLTFWVDPASNAAAQADAWRSSNPDDAAAMDRIAGQPVAKWLGDWNSDVQADVQGAMDEAEAVGSSRIFVVYNLPNRDCGGYSAGGASDETAYRAWIDAIAAGMGGRPSVVVLEPDGLSMVDCLSSSEADTRYALIQYATDTLQAAGALVYMDAGHSAWHPADVMAERLMLADVASASGFALNTSNFEATADMLAYGDSISDMTGGAHFIGDTSRNGLGPTADHAWCNPDGRALGLPPTAETGDPFADGLLWVKAPGESDGSCNGGPAAGTWWPEYALGLAQRATW